MNTLPIACSQVVATAVPFVTPAKPAEVAAHLLKPGVNTLAF
jgi:hypothetical protein